MTQILTTEINGLQCHELRNSAISLLVCPDVGGKIVSLKLVKTGQELLWTNDALELNMCGPGAAYDPNFFGGIDELLPNDELETINESVYPDHGELWTTRLKHKIDADSIRLNATLEIAGLDYEKTIRIKPDGENLASIQTDYSITNTRSTPNQFLWKLHAAMRVQPGDRVVCPAKTGTILDEEFTGRRGEPRFNWPNWKNDRLDIVAERESKRNEFFCLSELDRGMMRIESESANTFFEYQFDREFFPYAWLFATYGGWNGHYTAVLEPCSADSYQLSKSIANKTCTCLQPGEKIQTRVTINVGQLKT